MSPRRPVAALLVIGLLVGAGAAALPWLLPGRTEDTPSADRPAARSPVPQDIGLLPDLCLEIDASALGQTTRETAVKSLAGALAAEAAGRPDLFPDPVVLSWPDSSSTSGSGPAQAASGQDGAASTLRLAMWGVGGSEPSADQQRREALGAASCLPGGAGWGARVGRVLLHAGAGRRAASVELSPGVEAEVGVTFVAQENRVRTWLEFSMPLGIGGQCWVDDRLGVDDASGRVTVSRSTGQQVTPFGEYACERFLALMPEGGAGEQATTLLPTDVSLPGGGGLRLSAVRVEVEAEAILMSGSLGVP